MSQFGFGFEAGRNILPPELGRLMHDRLGATTLRYMVQWPLLEPEREKFDWAPLDETVANAKVAGLRVTINPYFLPKWVTLVDGVPRAVMAAYDDDCHVEAEVRKIGDPLTPAYCYRLVQPDLTAISALGFALGSKFGTTVDYSWYNEPGGEDYWLKPADEQPDQPNYGRRTYERWMATTSAFTRGLLKAVLNPVTVGLQADSEGLCDDCLYIERMDWIGDSWLSPPPTAFMFQRLSIHPYAGKMSDTPAQTTNAVAERSKLFLEKIDPWRAGREVEIGEIQHADNFLLLRKVAEIGISGVTEHNVMRYIVGGGPKQDGRVWHRDGTVTFEPPSGGWRLTDEGERFSRQMNPPRHRGVGK